jgi:GNAT superfamily N-acetyltransferase
MDVQIIKVRSKIELDWFINFPKDLYSEDTNFIFEPVSLQRDFLSHKNSFFEHSDAEYFIAVSEGRVVGRIASIKNTIHNKIYNEKTGFFGFFESTDNYEVAELLLDEVVKAQRMSGFNKIIGPTNFTTNDTCGMLISGYDMPPVVMMPYNKPYYNDYLERYGFIKEMDLCSYLLLGENILTTQTLTALLKKLNISAEDSGITFRSINYKKLDQEVIQFRDVYNESNKNNWGFMPMTEKDFKMAAKQLSEFTPERLMLFAEKEKQLIGFAVALPDLNQVFSHIKSGKLFPFGFIKYLWYKRKITNSRVLILGVLDEYRNKGVDMILYKKIQDNLASLGIYRGEACYVMENNYKMNRIMEKIGGVKIKKYRIYKYGI